MAPAPRHRGRSTTRRGSTRTSRSCAGCAARCGRPAERRPRAWETRPMSTPRVRDFHEDDLDQVVRVWEESRSFERRPVYGLAEILGALRDEGVALVVTVGEVVVGAAAARV